MNTQGSETLKAGLEARMEQYLILFEQLCQTTAFKDPASGPLTLPVCKERKISHCFPHFTYIAVFTLCAL